MRDVYCLASLHGTIFPAIWGIPHPRKSQFRRERQNIRSHFGSSVTTETSGSAHVISETLAVCAMAEIILPIDEIDETITSHVLGNRSHELGNKGAEGKGKDKGKGRDELGNKGVIKGKGKGQDKGKGNVKGRVKGRWRGLGLNLRPFRLLQPDVAWHFVQLAPLQVWRHIDQFWELCYMELD